MIAVNRPDLADAEWQSWRDKAKQEMERLVRAYHQWDEVSLQDELYKQAMPFLLKLFHGKCAYCETVISSNQPGDVEHYRPKGRIRDEQGKIIKIKVANREIDHPGYWWLAYDWRNLLPSCIDCNRRRRHGDENAPAGKAECFAVRGTRAVMPDDDLDREQALLLNPATAGFDPARHFQFMPDGTLKPLTDEARYSCELLGLNLRETLVTQREEEYLAASQALAYLLSHAVGAPRGMMTMTRRQINDMWEGRSPYSAFARQALQDACAEIRANTGMTIPLPLP
jgi:hypothetical protein